MSGSGLSLGLFMLMAGLAGCGGRAKVTPLSINLHQQWQLQPGTTVGKTRVTSGWGDLVLALEGQALYMPKAGRVEPLVSEAPQEDSACVAVSSPEIPAYELRLCHLHQLQLGGQPQGVVIGRGEQVAIAMLRKQPEGTWTFVEPAPSLLEALLAHSSSGLLVVDILVEVRRIIGGWGYGVGLGAGARASGWCLGDACFELPGERARPRLGRGWHCC